MTISTALFDLDGTLYDRDLLMQSLAENQYQAFRTELEPLDGATYVSRLIDLDDHGYRPKADVYAELGQRFSLSAELQSRLKDHFWSSYDTFCSLAADTRATLETLKSRGIRLGIITNGQSRRQQKKIDALGIRHFFDVIVVSEEVGLRKPDARIFHLALERCGASPEEAVFVGDHPAADIEGALQAGLSAVWKCVPYWRLTLEGVPHIDRLSQVLLQFDR